MRQISYGDKSRKLKISVRHLMGIAVLWLLFGMTGCGGSYGGTEENRDISPPFQEQKEVPRREETDAEPVYVPEYTALELGTGEEPYMAKLFGDSLYYVSRQYGDTVEDSRRSVCAYSLPERQIVRRVPVGVGYGNILNFSVAGDGSIYVLDFASDDGTNNGMEIRLLAFDPQGQRRWTVNLWTAAGTRSADIAPAVDDRGRVYLPVENRIVLFEADGSPAGEITLADRRYAVSIGADAGGTVYVGSASHNEENRQLAAVDFENKALGEIRGNYPLSGQKELIADTEGGFLVNTGEGVYRYDPDTETARLLFSWLDCNISSQSVVNVAPDAAEGVRAVIFENGLGELASLTRREADSLPEKTELVIGTLSIWPELERAVASFNRSNDQCHVTVRCYGSQYVGSSNWSTWEDDAITALNLDLVSAHDCPDLLALANLNVEAYARNGVFEDLGPWLDGSKALNREDYVENILDSYTYDGQLVSIPHSVRFITLSGNRRRVGDKLGWTLEEMMECAEANSDVELFALTYNQWVLRVCMRLGKSAFLDSQQAKCCFDSEEFRNLLRFAASYPDTPNQNYIGHMQGIMKDKVLLNELTISAFQDIQMFETMYGGEMTLIGYPTADGEGSGCLFSTENAYAVTARSGNKEAAWEFLEYCLCEDVSDGLPVHRGKLLEKATATEYYRDSQGWLVLGLDGRPMPKYDHTNYDGWPYEYHAVTEEEIDTLLYLMDTARLSADLDSTLWRIVFEEATPCFQGQKTVEDTASAIQNRISLYLQENR